MSRPGANHRKRLLVEGENDLHVVVRLYEAALLCPWPKSAAVWPFGIVPMKTSIRALTDWSTFLKTDAETTHFAILCDADQDASGCWQDIRRRLVLRDSLDWHGLPAAVFPNSPSPGGWIHRGGAIKLGAYILPDNSSPGMLETLLWDCLRQRDQPLGRYISDRTKGARKHGATFKDIHLHKALYHTYLAWNDPPDEMVSRKVSTEEMDFSDPRIASLVTWLVDMFDLKPAGGSVPSPQT